MCSAISLALVNSHTGSHIVVLSLQTLPPCPDLERDWYCRMEWGWLARLYFTVLWVRAYILVVPTDCNYAWVITDYD